MAISVDAIDDAGRDLQSELGAAGQAEIAAVRHLRVVVGESDGSERDVENTAIQMKRLLRSAQSSVGTTMAMTMSRPPMVGVPAFF